MASTMFYCRASSIRPPVKSVYLKTYFSAKTYVVGTQKNHLNEMVLLTFEHPKYMFKLMGKKKNDKFSLKNFA